MDTRRYGDLGERFARELLTKRGYKIIATNYRTKFGEIDIIAIDECPKSDGQKTLVFVEVKTRRTKKFGYPAEAVNARKLYRIRRAGELFALIHKDLPKKQRIDVVAIEIENGRVTSAKIIPVI